MSKVTNTTVRYITTFLNQKEIEFGDYILFQEYQPEEGFVDDPGKRIYKVSKPILAIYLGCFVADQTIGFNYVVWNNDRHTVYITNEYVTRHPVCKEVGEVKQHIEWSDYIDVLGHWKHKPKWKEIIKSYRQQNVKESIQSSEFEVNKQHE